MQGLKTMGLFRVGRWIFPEPNGYHFIAFLRELEAILRIYIKMFQLIEPELEEALAKESAERAA